LNPKNNINENKLNVFCENSKMPAKEGYTTRNNKKNGANAKKQQKLRKGKNGPPESSDEEEEWEDCDDDDEPDEPVKKSKKAGKSKVLDEDEDEDDLDPREFRKTLAAMFPSKYMDKKVKQDSKKHVRRLRNRVVEVVDDEDEDEDYDEDEDEDEDEDYDEDEEYHDEEEGFNVIFAYGPGNKVDEEDEAAIEDGVDEECDSDDEAQFMKEKYEKVVIPEPEPKNDIEEKTKSLKKGKKVTEEDEEDSMEIKDVEDEYMELIELKKHLSEKLSQRPKSKILLNAVEECRQSIRELVKKTRRQNARKYHKMINAEKHQTNEIEYFKKSMSNKEQLRIMRELQEINEHMRIAKPYRLTLLESSIPSKYKATVMQKVNLLRSMEPSDSEYHKIKYWVDAFMRIPFSIYKNLSIKMDDGMDKCTEFMENSKKILDDCAYGLEDAKMQIMQMVGQWIANPSAMGSAIAIKGPMGTGKTTLVKDGISKILGREFAFIALGGTGDASFLEGHSYTYEGSTWGKIAQILMDSKCMNPVIYFDELDKISDTARGQEIVGILTHLTDTTQNSQFHDKYFSEVDFDMSKCLFIFSYNDESLVNPILKDRMYRIETKGYDAKEKVIIARNYLLPKIREQVNFKEEEVIIPEETLQYIISNAALTNGEAGVRNLKRCLEIIHTKVNLHRLMKAGSAMFGKEAELKVTFPFTVTKEAVDVFIKNEERQNQSLLAMYV
jgi:ATP-dependent Lon protease